MTPPAMKPVVKRCQTDRCRMPGWRAAIASSVDRVHGLHGRGPHWTDWKACSPTSLRRSQAENWSTAMMVHRQQQHDRQRLGFMALADRKPKQLADAAAADRADDGRGAHVDLEPQQEIAHEVRHDLRHHAEPDALDPVGADRPQPFVRLHVGILDDLEEHLAERADRVDRHGDDRRDRARARRRRGRSRR